MGDNGVFNKAQNAKNETTKANAEEKLKMAVLASYSNDGNLSIDDIKENVGKISGAQINGDTYPLTVSLDGYMFKIEAGGKVELTTGVTISKTELKMVAGNSYTLTAIKSEDITGEITWESSNKGVATVENGLVTVANGTALSGTDTSKMTTITAKVGEEHKAECLVTVVNSVTILTAEQLADIKLQPGEYKDLELETNSIEKLTYSPSASGIITINENGRIEALTEGEVTITITGESSRKTKTVKVVVKVKPIEVGSYVKYNVPYTDMFSYTTNSDNENIYTEYNQNNGWRYLGTDDNGNKLIVSTGIPAMLYYNSDGTNQTWWGSSGNTNVKVADGLKNNFETIPFYGETYYNTTTKKNYGYYKKVGSNVAGSESGQNYQLPSTAFRDTTLNTANKIVGVHNLTLEELNRATNLANGKQSGDSGYRADDSVSPDFRTITGEANGLFHLNTLTGFSGRFNYWLASPRASSTDNVYYVGDLYSDYVNVTSVNIYIYILGIRPVVVLTPDVQLEIVN